MRIIAGLIGAALSGMASFGQAMNTNQITGEWELNGNLSASIGAPLQWRGDIVPSLETVIIAGQNARVLRLPALAPEQAMIMPHGALPNGGGTNVNEFTLLMDVMWPAESDAAWRAILQSDPSNAEDAILFVNPANLIGINNNYEGEVPANVWHRLALVYSLTNGTLTKYLNGDTNAFTQTLGNSVVDSRFSLRPTALLFSDDSGETAPVLINSLQFRSVAMTAEGIAALGAATAGGISGAPGEAVEVKIERIEKVSAEIVLAVSGGGSLQLQKTASLAAVAWQNIGAPAATNTFRVPADGAKAFFRFERR